ncbi:MAG: acetoacetyl-CoA reductase [Alphaproteobacteria bacterium]
MSNRVAIVTGGTRGIGAGIALALKNAGYRVAATYQGNDAVAAEFRDATGIATYKWDVADFKACGEGLARVAAELGPVDVLVNNAGITRDVMLHRMTDAQWHEVVATNLTSCFNMARHVIGSMRERRFGRIVSIASINGQKGQLGQTNYAATKAGLIGFTKALALEGASRGVTANAIAAGYVATEMVAAVPQAIRDQIVASIPVGRLGEPADIARAVLFLAADTADWITGSTLTVNGGQYLT